MSVRLGQVCLAAILALTSREVIAGDSPPSTEQIRVAINRSLPYLEQAGRSWMDNKKCVSCHRVSFLTWAFSEASRKGFDVDRSKIEGWIEWSATKSLESRGEGKPVDGALNLDGLAQLIIGHSADSAVTLPNETGTQFTNLLLKEQQPDGSWKAGGQLPDQKRSKEETAQVSTMWNAYALRLTASSGETQEARRRALEWLKPATSGTSTEWYSARVLLAAQDRNSEGLSEAITQLKQKQHSDGGWGWLTDDPSDALATGQALYALAIAGVDSSDPVIQNSVRFLLSTQKENGTWAVRGTKAKKKDKVEETANYWGTGWATIALLQTLP